MSRFKDAKENEWYKPITKDFRLSCCDCGLTHSFDFKIENKRVWFRLRRNNRSTGQIRRWKFKDA